MGRPDLGAVPDGGQAVRRGHVFYLHVGAPRLEVLGRLAGHTPQTKVHLPPLYSNLSVRQVELGAVPQDDVEVEGTKPQWLCGRLYRLCHGLWLGCWLDCWRGGSPCWRKDLDDDGWQWPPGRGRGLHGRGPGEAPHPPDEDPVDPGRSSHTGHDEPDEQGEKDERGQQAAHDTSDATCSWKHNKTILVMAIPNKGRKRH